MVTLFSKWEKFHGLITAAEAERLLDNDIQIYETLIQENIAQLINATPARCAGCC